MKYFDIMNTSSNNEGLEFNEKKYEQFMRYKDLIQEWNEKVNLTAIKEDEEIVKKHFIDSIKVFKFKELKSAKNIIDIGTGGGFPGIPMNLIKPEINIVLLDSLNKRINFLNEVIKELQLKNIKAIHGRAEDFAQEKQYREKFDVAVSRAVANLTVLSEFCIPYVKVGGYFVAMKGPAVEEEIKSSKNAIRMLGGHIEHIEKVQIEDSDFNHNLVIIRKIAETHKKYPRKAGMVTKNPLV
ncbi:16S rRNA (guanine(527)-N(7))-methyltransferase RsmG [Clostridium tagluense]|uniref:16S rRNA (guanine(527)-N(7))-methyltransferase RsmG n=1 Tax=Clostridium tagluense TaxID=360422 RepID=UPI001CF58314|nr:16S rRNA (guanine(527)-N(7))-methyltransferase RsmG [Clostridium tagluense]MCB2313141.1 16S rRNA (guanine(527)-N(7))-methyltransferase RsmG [Clostridium tagluense]MCB2317907.1 16S rRNA (guanine(527)-N(7))-methyltransferase RsmG [Clostridium tagluense]MCB2322692.1 16S rRNA (guanine(527)-N(7))-methyltransferase RsmG [Clostridium tagluense]MCB2327654.1 16S rRNA (guanine(527)-N(7))-methyltransferase RsmG [Clostridium tagluense]MCB2332337.1 16S rRNA (guanine(527)-N(7))-methyltransferase RsmG [Cl